MEIKQGLYKFKLKKGVKNEKISEIEAKLATKLPSELKAFYAFSNGIEGSYDEPFTYLFNIISLEDILIQEDRFGEYLEFAEYMIYSEVCGLEIDKLDKNKYQFFIPRTGNGEDQRVYITNSIKEFISIFTEKGTFGIFKN